MAEYRSFEDVLYDYNFSKIDDHLWVHPKVLIRFLYDENLYHLASRHSFDRWANSINYENLIPYSSEEIEQEIKKIQELIGQ
jgi:hypothetical protein